MVGYTRARVAVRRTEELALQVLPASCLIDQRLYLVSPPLALEFFGLIPEPVKSEAVSLRRCTVQALGLHILHKI